MAIEPELRDAIGMAWTGTPYGPGNENSVDAVLEAILSTPATRAAMRRLLAVAANDDPSSGDAS